MRTPAPNPKPRHWADRHYSPLEAAYAIAQYTDFNPGFYLRQCEKAGLELTTDGKLIHFGAADGVDDRMAFLMTWLKLDQAGRAVRRSLKRRGLIQTLGASHETA